MKNMIIQAVSTIIAIAMLQSIFMFPFWFFWNEIIIKMINGLNPIIPIHAWLFLVGINVFKYYMIEPAHVQNCIEEHEPSEESKETEEE